MHVALGVFLNFCAFFRIFFFQNSLIFHLLSVRIFSSSFLSVFSSTAVWFSRRRSQSNFLFCLNTRNPICNFSHASHIPSLFPYPIIHPDREGISGLRGGAGAKMPVVGIWTSRASADCSDSSSPPTYLLSWIPLSAFWLAICLLGLSSPYRFSIVQSISA